MTAEKFNKLQTDTYLFVTKLQAEGKRLTKIGRQHYPFYDLKKMGITGITALKKEYKLLQQKKSNRSKRERQIIVYAYALLGQGNTNFINVAEFVNYIETKKNKENELSKRTS